jgi:hypothetical protein
MSTFCTSMTMLLAVNSVSIQFLIIVFCSSFRPFLDEGFFAKIYLNFDVAQVFTEDILL